MVSLYIVSPLRGNDVSFQNKAVQLQQERNEKLMPGTVTSPALSATTSLKKNGLHRIGRSCRPCAMKTPLKSKCSIEPSGPVNTISSYHYKSIKDVKVAAKPVQHR